jgi:uncharacterized protein (TIRG00374 family)
MLASMATPRTVKSSRKRWQWLYLLLCLFGLYAIVPQVNGFRHSFGLLEDARLKYVAAAIAFAVTSYVSAALTYRVLAGPALRYMRTLLVQFASTFVNRLLPAGVGGIGANYAYLKKSRLPTAKAAAVVVLNNTLGLVGHCLLVVIVLVLIPSHLHALHTPHVSARTLLEVFLAIVFVIIVLVFVRSLRMKILNALHSFAKQITGYKAHPVRVGGALLSSMSLTLLNVLCLWMSCFAVGIHSSFITVLLVFTLGIAVGTVTPTPGGLGGVEAGLVVGLVANHITASQSLAAVLLFRLVSYWLTLIIGGGCFAIVQKRHYL